MIHIVDDDDSFRIAIGRMLKILGYSVTEYSSAGQFLASIPDSTEFSCILLDVSMPGLSGPTLQERLAELGSLLPIVFLSGHGDIPTTVRVIKAGAVNFLTKPVSEEVLVEAIRQAEAQYRSGREQQDQLKASRILLDKLTPREREVFELVVRGKINKRIAFQLGITERTIKAHRRRIVEKLQIRSLAELVSMAERLGLIM